jgi:beta-glucosidase
MLVSAMSLDDQIALLNLDVGPDKENILGDQPAYCIPEFVLQDGPNGVSSSGGYALPASIATAATFDPTAAHDYGVALAMSAEAKGHTAVQAPDLNLAVVPSWGRIGETYGEDPFLAGLMGTAESHAVVDSGSQVLIKHLSVYTHEQNRGGANTTVGTTTREEVFEAPFRQVVKAVNPLGVMCAYGTVNGVPNCADPDLVARYRAWGGTGFIRTDLKAQSSPIAALNAGVGVFKPTLQAEMRSAVDRGAISAELIATRATDLMTDLFARGLMDHPRAPLVAKADARAQCVTTATEVANESLVLLKNSGVLPLSSKTGSLAIMGSAAALSPTYALGGSSYVPLKSPVSFAQALISAVKPAKTVIQPSMPKMPATVLMRRQQSDGTGATTTTSLSFTAPHRGRYLAELGLNYGESSAVVRVDGQQYGWVLVQRGDGIRHTTWVMTLDPGVHKVDITWQSAGPTPVFTIQDVEAVLLQAAATARSVDIPVVFVASASSEDYDHNTLGLPGFQDPSSKPWR